MEHLCNLRISIISQLELKPAVLRLPEGWSVSKLNNFSNEPTGLCWRYSSDSSNLLYSETYDIVKESRNPGMWIHVLDISCYPVLEGSVISDQTFHNTYVKKTLEKRIGFLCQHGEWFYFYRTYRTGRKKCVAGLHDKHRLSNSSRCVERFFKFFLPFVLFCTFFIQLNDITALKNFKRYIYEKCEKRSSLDKKWLITPTNFSKKSTICKGPLSLSPLHDIEMVKIDLKEPAVFRI